MSKFQPGDWLFSCQFASGDKRWTRAYRVKALDVHTVPYIVLDGVDCEVGPGVGFSRSSFRIATQEEINATPILRGNLINVVSGGTPWRAACDHTVSCGEPTPPCEFNHRHATPEEWRRVNKIELTKSVNNATQTPIEHEENSEVLPNSSEEISEDSPLKDSTEHLLGFDAQGTAEDHAEKLKEHELRLAQIEREASPDVLATRVESLHQSVDHRLSLLEAKPPAPPEPELPPLLRTRIPRKHDFTADERYILVDGTPDDDGRLGYHRGRRADEKRQRQGMVRLWPQTLTPVIPDTQIDEIRLDSHNTGRKSVMKAVFVGVFVAVILSYALGCMSYRFYGKYGQAHVESKR